MALVAGLALVSCNENFDEDMPAINYPENRHWVFGKMTWPVKMM